MRGWWALAVIFLATTLACQAAAPDETPVEQSLWAQGLYPVTGILVGDTYVDWAEAAYHSFRYIPVNITHDGGVRIFDTEAIRGPLRALTCDKPDASILDIPATACRALGIEGDFDGKPLNDVNASQVVILYVDALGLERYRWASLKGATNNISSTGAPIIAYVMYPSISRVNAAALVTGVRPERSGVDRWENIMIKTPTVFDLAAEKGVTAAWVDGMTPPVMLKYGTINVRDADGDGSADDEILARALEAYECGTRLLYVHLKDPDKALHATGPYSPESLESIRKADAQAGLLMSRLKPGTLLIITADHGGHDVAGGKGDHGTLLFQDMLVPVFEKAY